MDVAEAFDTVFLSTPSARRATLTLRKQIDEDKISIHALREEGDLQLQQCPLELELISIHALREEGDVPWLLSIGRCMNFYPRPPRGGRPGLIIRTE